MPISVSLAIWAAVLVFAAIAFFVARFLHQLTKIGIEGERTLQTLNSKLPVLLQRAELLMDKADSTITRVNDTLDQLDLPLHYINLAGQLFSGSKVNFTAKIGKAVMALLAGFKTGKSVFAAVRQHFSCKRHEDEEQ